MKLTKERIVYKTAEVIEHLRAMYPAGSYAFLQEVGNSTGFSCKRHADVIVMSLWPSRGLEIIGMEVKVSRTDWVKELGQPEKADIIFGKCDRWYLVVGDERIVQDGELPKGWGLMVPKKDGLRISVQAVQNLPEPKLDRPFLAAILRQSCYQATKDAYMKKEYQRGRNAGIEEEKNSNGSWQAEASGLRKAIEEFERASGVSIRGYHGPKRIGDAVQRVLNGMDGRVREQLEQLHGHALRIAQAIETELQKDLPTSGQKSQIRPFQAGRK